MDNLKLVNELNGMILQGQVMDAFEKFYAENVSMSDNNQNPMIGKDANRERELAFVNGVSEWLGAEVLAVTATGDVTMVEWMFHYKHKEWGEKKYYQVAVQRWENGKIIDERFYFSGY